MIPLLHQLKDGLSTAIDERGDVDPVALLLFGGLGITVFGVIGLAVPHLLDQVIYGTCKALQGAVTTIECAKLPP